MDFQQKRVLKELGLFTTLILDLGNIVLEYAARYDSVLQELKSLDIKSDRAFRLKFMNIERSLDEIFFEYISKNGGYDTRSDDYWNCYLAHISRCASKNNKTFYVEKREPRKSLANDED